MGAHNGCRLRIYGFTDLPPSLPLLPGTLGTRTCESSYRRRGWAWGVSGGRGGEATGMGSQAAIRATPIALGGPGGGGLAALAQQRRLYH